MRTGRLSFRKLAIASDAQEAELITAFPELTGYKVYQDTRGTDDITCFSTELYGEKSGNKYPSLLQSNGTLWYRRERSGYGNSGNERGNER